MNGITGLFISPFLWGSISWNVVNCYDQFSRKKDRCLFFVGIFWNNLSHPPSIPYKTYPIVENLSDMNCSSCWICADVLGLDPIDLRSRLHHYMCLLICPLPIWICKIGAVVFNAWIDLSGDDFFLCELFMFSLLQVILLLLQEEMKSVI